MPDVDGAGAGSVNAAGPDALKASAEDEVAEPAVLAWRSTSDSSCAMLSAGHSTVGATLGDRVGEMLGDAVGSTLGDVLGDKLGVPLGEALGDAVGGTVGDRLGDRLGVVLGEELGDALGDTLGEALGVLLGDVLGETLGKMLGEAVGEAQGLEPADGVDGPLGASAQASAGVGLHQRRELGLGDLGGGDPDGPGDLHRMARPLVVQAGSALPRAAAHGEAPGLDAHQLQQALAQAARAQSIFDRWHHDSLERQRLQAPGSRQKLAKSAVLGNPSRR